MVEADGKQSDMTVNLPYAQENEKLTVIGLPYVANKIDSVGHIGTARFDKTGKTINDSEVTAKVVKFTKQFAQKYVSSSTKVHSIMKNKILLSIMVLLLVGLGITMSIINGRR